MIYLGLRCFWKMQPRTASLTAVMCKQQFYQVGALYNNSLSVHFDTPNNHYDMTVLMKNPFDHKLL